MHRGSSAISSATLLIALAACAGVEPEAPLPAAPKLVRIDTVALAGDRRSVSVDFAGARQFDPSNPCTAAYEGTAEVDDEELVIGVYEQPHPGSLPEGVACDSMGHPRSLVLPLEQAFDGMRIRDLAGQVLLLDAPERSARIMALPAGWELRREGSVGESMTPRWSWVYSPDPDPWPADGSPLVQLYQAFGGPVKTTGAARQADVEVNGTPAAFYVYPPAGEMVLVWSLGPDELALVGYRDDFSEEEFIELAESVQMTED